MKGFEVISVLKNYLGANDIIVSSNGNISREVYNLLPKPQVYLRGSMGLPVAVGLGLALSNPEKKIIVITGDGNFLMGLGSSVTAAFYKPDNLKILILDNVQYYTTGGQKYQFSKTASHGQIDQDLTKFFNSRNFCVLHLKIKEVKRDLENIPWHPEEITKRLKSTTTT
jgi:thiamine pyrophosphate-dependent acetolactate synthase large subunit-like protein